MDNLEDVEDLTSLWTFDESAEDVKRQLQKVASELAEARKAAIEQGKTHKEKVKKLIQLLGIVYKERDEARDQLHNLIMMKPHDQLRSPQNPLMMSSSKIIDRSTGSSSSDPSSLNVGADILSSCSSSYDRGSATIENLAKGKPRPEKGKLLQSVMKAGPLLDTLLVAGLLPQWRDPPPVMRTSQVPPVPIEEYKVQAQTRTPTIGVTSNILGIPNASSTTNILSFGGVSSFGSYLNPSANGFSHQITKGKRQRIQ